MQSVNRFVGCEITGGPLALRSTQPPEGFGGEAQDVLERARETDRIGVNDKGRGVPLDQYEQTYDKLLTDAKAANPKLKLVLCEPFIVIRIGDAITITVLVTGRNRVKLGISGPSQVPVVRGELIATKGLPATRATGSRRGVATVPDQPGAFT